MKWKVPDLDSFGELYEGFSDDRDRLTARLTENGYDPNAWWHTALWNFSKTDDGKRCRDADEAAAVLMLELSKALEAG